MTGRRSIDKKHTSGEAPRCVRCAILPGHRRVRRARRSPTAVVVAAGAAPVAAGAEPAAGTGRSSRSQSSQRDVTRGRSRPAACGVLVDTSVYLKPAELVDVALDVLAGLTPCLNLGVGELGHKDLLDTIGADNCRK